MASLTDLSSAPAISFNPLGLLRAAAEPLTAGVGAGYQAIVGGVTGALDSASGTYPGIPGDLQGLLGEQTKMQKEMLYFSFYSNVEKTRHETQMVAVRNMKLG